MSGEENMNSMTKIDIHDNDNKMPEQKQTPSPKDMPENLHFVTSSTKHKLRYAFTIPGMFKLIHLILNLVCFVLFLPGWSYSTYHSPGNWLWLATGCGFCISAFLFILYSFNLINRDRKKTWIVDSVYCAIWALIIFVFIFVVRHHDGSLIVCVLLTVIYLIDAYIKCYGWVQNDFSIGERNIFNSQKPPSPYEVVSNPTSKIPYKSATSEPLFKWCPKLNVSRDAFNKFFYYIKSVAGILKIFEMIFELVCFVLLKSSPLNHNYYYRYYYYSSDYTNCALYWLTFASISGFCITGVLVSFYTLRLIQRARKLTWILESVYSFIWGCFMLVTSIILSVYIDKNDNNNGCLITAATLGFIITVIYAVDCGLKIHGCVKNIIPLGEPKEQALPAPPAQV